ncbi:MAG UNVERIFIED_CONTAM: hypothetical protein LVR18_42855 [Planctomycetaceae bacterium]
MISGGDVTLVQNAAGETTGYQVSRAVGSSTLSITSDAQIKVGQEIYAGSDLTLSAGIAVASAGIDFSDIGIVITGSGTLRTGAAGSNTIITSASGIRLLASAGLSAPEHAIQSPGAGSGITLRTAAEPAVKFRGSG